jgi:transposase-like protein
MERETTMTKPRSLSEYARAMLRRALAFSDTAPAVFTSENVRALLGADETSMSCPLCGNTGRVDGGKLCQEFRCDECGHRFAKST